MNDAVHAATLFLVLCVGVACALAAWRVARGPTRTDRVIALDILLAGALALCVAASLLTGRTVYIDVGIGLALVGFVGTVGWSRLIQRSALARHNPPPHKPQEPEA
ncbi:MAG: monovalent cation/H+ antiporter complex subunit F [Pseudomonadota bacterium]|nr:monovalent cation/H+ antiporter complex subunit F [Pseudomonadota bacterium]